MTAFLTFYLSISIILCEITILYLLHPTAVLSFILPLPLQLMGIVINFNLKSLKKSIIIFSYSCVYSTFFGQLISGEEVLKKSNAYKYIRFDQNTSYCYASCFLQNKVSIQVIISYKCKSYVLCSLYRSLSDCIQQTNIHK